MNNKKRLSIALTTGEKWLGWLYMPIYLAFLSVILMAAFELLGWDMESTQGKARLNGVFFLVNFLAAVLIFHKFLWKNFHNIGKRFWGFVQAVILGFVMYYAGLYLINLLLKLVAPDMSNLNDESIVTLFRASKWIMLPGTVLLAPVAEECFVRGLVFGGLHRRSRVLAYIASTLLFSFMHVGGYIGTAPWWQLGLCFLQYVPAGIALAWAYEKADSLFAPILMHCIINALSLGALG